MPKQGTASGPPDTRGGTAPLPASIFAVGIAALLIVIGGVGVTQYVYHSGGREISPGCAQRLTIKLPEEEPRLAQGGESVCRTVDALKSDMQAGLLIAGLVVAVVAIAGGFGLYRRLPTRRQRNHSIAGAVLGIQAVLLAVILLWFRSGDVLIFARNFFNFTFLEGSMDGFIRGAKNTLLLAFAGEALGVAIGLSLALLMISKHRVVRAPATGYINFFRGTPLIWQLAFFSALFLLGFQWRDAVFEQAIIIFGLNMGAYSAEVFRAGIQSVEKGQTEAARSLGMTYLQSMGYVIVPQAVRRVIPPLMNEFVILIKDTSLITVLGLTADQYDIFTFSRSFFSDSRNATIFLGTATAYLVVTLPLIKLVNSVEKRLRSGLVGVAG
jgi:His/Glu/Gln/Arg/opine family amino acid ABC transporter permease subunit